MNPFDTNRKTQSDRLLAVAASQPLANPTDAMIDAAHKAASFDDLWAINSRCDFKRAVKAMFAASAIKQDSSIL